MADRLTPIINGMADLSPADLQVIVDTAQRIMERRSEQRRKELWGNVRAAIQKYCTEFNEDIETYGYQGKGVICLDKLDGVGILYIAN